MSGWRISDIYFDGNSRKSQLSRSIRDPLLKFVIFELPVSSTELTSLKGNASPLKESKLKDEGCKKKKGRSTLVEGCYLCWEQVAGKNSLDPVSGTDTTAMATEHRFQTIYVQTFSTSIVSFSIFLHLFSRFGTFYRWVQSFTGDSRGKRDE